MLPLPAAFIPQCCLTSGNQSSALFCKGIQLRCRCITNVLDIGQDNGIVLFQRNLLHRVHANTVKQIVLLGQQMIPAAILCRENELTLTPEALLRTNQCNAGTGEIGVVILLVGFMIAEHFFEGRIAGFVRMIVQTSHLVEIGKATIGQHLSQTQLLLVGRNRRMAIPHIDKIHAGDRGNHLRAGIPLQLEQL